MITCHQLICTIPWLSCKQLPYPSEPPRPTCARYRDKSKIPLLQAAYKQIPPEHSSSTLRLQSLTFSLSGGDSDEQLRDLNQQELFSSVNLKSPARAPIFLKIMAINFNVPAVRSTSITFYFDPPSFCKSIQLVIFPFFCSPDPLNLGTAQQISYSNRSAACPMPRTNGQPRSNWSD